MRIISWNVNGIRACVKQGFAEFLDCSEADIIGVQEVRALSDEIPSAARNPSGWHTVFSAAERRGYTAGSGSIPSLNRNGWRPRWVNSNSISRVASLLSTFGPVVAALSWSTVIFRRGVARNVITAGCLTSSFLPAGLRKGATPSSSVSRTGDWRLQHRPLRNRFGPPEIECQE